ncbi:hypothetical protein C8R43DRAFT_1125607 [Mycena crocata]|nr:hypothetical protein C8R43DRAFT_1125607 [Mycena crocata]
MPSIPSPEVIYELVSLVSRDTNMTTYDPLTETTLIDPNTVNRDLALVPYPVEADGSPVTPERLQAHAQTHTFKLPACFHRLPTNVTLSFTQDTGSIITLECANTSNEDKCPFSINLSNLMANTSAMEFRRYDPNIYEPEDGILSLSTDVNPSGNTGNPDLANIESVVLIKIFAGHSKSGFQSRGSDAASQQSIQPENQPLSNASSRPRTSSIQASMTDESSGDGSATPDSMESDKSFIDLESPTPSTDTMESDKSFINIDSRTTSTESMDDEPSTVDFETTTASSTGTTNGLATDQSFIRVEATTISTTSTTGSGEDSASPLSPTSESIDSKDSQLPAFQYTDMRNGTAALQRVANELSQKLKRWARSQTVPKSADASGDAGTSQSSYSLRPSQSTRRPIQPTLSMASQTSIGDLCDPPCAMCIYVRNDPTVKTGDHEVI